MPRVTQQVGSKAEGQAKTPQTLSFSHIRALGRTQGSGRKRRVCQPREAKWGRGPATQRLGATGQRTGIAPRPQ